MIKYRVISGKYSGRIGFGEKPNQLGLVMFYPIEGIHPYRVCLSASELEEIKDDVVIFDNNLDICKKVEKGL